MKPSLTETMTSRKGILFNECDHVDLIVECKLLRKSTNSSSFPRPLVQIMKIASMNLS